MDIQPAIPPVNQPSSPPPAPPPFALPRKKLIILFAVFVFSLILVLISRFLPQSSGSAPVIPIPVVSPAVTLSPKDTAAALLSAVARRNTDSLDQFILPNADFSACPAPLNPLSSASLPENSYQILGEYRDPAGTLSYLAVSFTESGSSRLYQLIFSSSSSSWKLIACRAFGTPAVVSSDSTDL